MAHRFSDSFDHMTGAANSLLVTKWDNTSVTNGPTIVSSPVLTGSGSCRFVGGSSVQAVLYSQTFSGAGSTFVCNFKFYLATPTGGSATEYTIVTPLEGGVVHCRLRLTTARKLKIQRGDGTDLGTGTQVLDYNNWYRISYKCVINNSTGSATVKIDGATDISLTSQDTRNGGTSGVWDQFVFVGPPTTWAMNQYIDDLLVFDGNGGVNNDIPSTNWFVTCELPKTDAVSAGANAGLTPSTGSDHGALVDENPPSTSDYNGHATAGNKDTYKFAAPSTGGGTIIGVQVNIYALKSDAGAKTACPVVRHSGSDYDGTTFTLLTTAKYFTQVYETNPGTGSAWVAANVTEFGMKVVS